MYKTIFFKILFVGYLLFAASLSLCEDIHTSFTASVDKTEVKIGQPITYTLKAVYPLDSNPGFPEFSNQIGDFEIKSCDRKDARMKTADFMESAFKYKLSGYDIGSYIIPPAKLGLILADGSKKDYLSGQIFIEVKSALGENPEDIKDIKTALKIPGFSGSYMIIAVCLLFILCLAYLYYRSSKGLLKIGKMPSIFPHEKALNALNDLKESDLVNRGLMKTFYFRLSAIMRYYIEERFGLRAPERTTEEFLAEISNADVFNTGQRNYLKSFLKASDIVKFAKHEPQLQEAISSFEKTVDFVNETKEDFEEKEPQI
ncbi:MAG: hypothetical protein KAQ99_08960 [Candidatus Aureabacteria bacterium]|nr:hypothetical protein [Candidatus Auribacterota bacterium]MCK5161688.1 hypothetical protein [Candidatus Auribacterota bacterium]MCK5656147.1 hypothetical protein [Candidatus Auribacterota bacterium]